jgi:hypothetical protein
MSDPWGIRRKVEACTFSCGDDFQPRWDAIGVTGE